MPKSDNPYSPPNAEVEPEVESVVHPEAGPEPALPAMAESDQFVNVYSTADLAEAEMLDQMLRSEGIPTPGFSKVTGAQMGAGWMAGNHVIRVPSEREAEASALIEAFLQAPSEVPEEAGEADELKSSPQTRGQRLTTFYWRLLTVGVVLWLLVWLFTLLPKADGP